MFSKMDPRDHPSTKLKSPLWPSILVSPPWGQTKTRPDRTKHSCRAVTRLDDKLERAQATCGGQEWRHRRPGGERVGTERGVGGAGPILGRALGPPRLRKKRARIWSALECALIQQENCACTQSLRWQRGTSSGSEAFSEPIAGAEVYY